MGRPPTTPDDIRVLLAPLYARCAASDPSLLEAVLDAIEDLRRRDRRDPTSHHQHPERVIADVVVNLDRLPDESVPQRVITWAQRRLHALGSEETATPLSLLRPLLAKHVHITRQVDPRTLQMGGYLVSPEWASPFRSQIRRLLLEQASGYQLRRAGEAIDLLGVMLQPLRPPQGVTVTDTERTAWATDDLATVETFAAAARATPSSAVRRCIREKVSHRAARAGSSTLRHAALALVTDLDQRVEDDVAEEMLPVWHAPLASQRGRIPPDLPEVVAQMAQEREAQQGRDAANTSPELSAWERLQIAHALNMDRAVTALQALGDPSAIARALHRCASEVASVVGSRQPRVSGLCEGLTVADAALARPLLLALSELSPGPTDAALEVLLERWAQDDEASLLQWLATLGPRRREVRIAVATAFVRHRWHLRGPVFLPAFDAGVAEADVAVREAFLVGVFLRYLGTPGAAASMLLDRHATARTCEVALHWACAYEDDQAWGRALGEADAELVLQVVERASWTDWTGQRITSGIAATHLDLVLDYLLEHPPSDTSLHDQIDGLPEVLEVRSTDFAAWMARKAPRLAERGPCSVINLAMPDGIGSSTATALHAHVQSADKELLLALVTVLEQVSGWTAQQPVLARAVIEQARALPSGTLAAVLGGLRRGMGVMLPMYMDGVSEELQAAHDLAATAAEAETDPDLRRVFEQARDDLSQEIRWGVDHYSEDD